MQTASFTKGFMGRAMGADITQVKFLIWRIHEKIRQQVGGFPAVAKGNPNHQQWVLMHINRKVYVAEYYREKDSVINHTRLFVWQPLFLNGCLQPGKGMATFFSLKVGGNLNVQFLGAMDFMDFVTTVFV